MEFEPQENAAFQPSRLGMIASKKKTLVIRQAFCTQTRLGRIVVVESMGNLHDSMAGSAKKPTVRMRKFALRDKIGIKKSRPGPRSFWSGHDLLLPALACALSLSSDSQPLCVAELLEPRPPPIVE